MSGEIQINTNKIEGGSLQNKNLPISVGGTRGVNSFGFKVKAAEILKYITSLVKRKYMQAPYFESKRKQVSLISSFKNKLNKRIGKGGFGSVFRVTIKTKVKDFLESQGVNVNKLIHVGKQNKMIHVGKQKIRTKKKLDMEVLTSVVAKQIKSEKSYNIEFASGSLLDSIPKHPNIISMIGDSYEEKILMYQDAGDSLFDLTFNSLDKRIAMNEILYLNLMIQLCSGVEHLHKHDIVHRDIKPENISVKPNTGILKLIDIGFLSKTKLIKNRAGTHIYLPPEFLREVHLNPEYYKSVDVYALGLVMADILPFVTDIGKDFMIFGEKGIEEFNQMSKKERSKHRLNCVMQVIGNLKWSIEKGLIDVDVMEKDFPLFREKILPLIQKMLSFNADDRPTAKVVVGQLKEIYKDEQSVKGGL